MLEALRNLNESRESNGCLTLHLRIGIHWSSAVVGCCGGPMRSDYVVIGDTVNLALRFQSAA